jgi:NAD(P)-dependent dehydrogenase (short-subunit alcohol dehydrogenase family)
LRIDSDLTEEIEGRSSGEIRNRDHGRLDGFGALTARRLTEAGHTVYATMRETFGRNAKQVEAARKFAAEKNVDLRTAELDVSSQESADRAVQQVLGAAGRLGIIIHNAGHMVFGPAEAWSVATGCRPQKRRTR